jgi:hypothetical protein
VADPLLLKVLAIGVPVSVLAAVAALLFAFLSGRKE